MNQVGLAEWWSKMLDKEQRRCHVPSKICREIGDVLLDTMLEAEKCHSCGGDGHRRYIAADDQGGAVLADKACHACGGR